jgi:hypothetical protein
LKAGSLVKSFGAFFHGRTPGQLVIQFTDHCNALCPQCGMRVSSPFPRHRLDMDDVKRMLDVSVQKGVRVVSFTGGEPLLYINELTALIRHAKAAGIDYIRTGTNGYIFAHPESPRFMSRVYILAERLAGTPLRNLWFSIDSAVPEVHESMRGFPGVIRGMEKALPVFHEHMLFPSANLGINRNLGGGVTARARIHTGSKDEIEFFRRAYKKAFRSFYGFVEGLGFTMVNSCYPMSVEQEEGPQGLSPVYGATSSEDIVRFKDAEKAELFRALFRVIPEFRARLRIFSPRISLRGLYRRYGREPDEPYPCRGGLDYFFVDAKSGNTFPCGFRGEENLGRFWNLETRRTNGKGGCILCDWECFRDPSELFGPLLEALHSPLRLLNRIRRDPGYAAVWIRDLDYYLACDLFDGRRPPNYAKLARFKKVTPYS